jgi:chromosome segregation ATPase
MNYKKVSLPIMLLLTASLLLAQHRGPKAECPERHYGWEKGKRRGEFFQERINKLAEKGVISQQEKQELESAIEDLKKYRQEVWSDGKLTKEEQQSLIEKEKAVREKTRQVLEKAKEELAEEWRDPKEREKMFNEKIDVMVKNKKISKKEAEELKKQHKELLELEEKIWSDGVMTKEEKKELFEKRKKFNEKLKKFHHKN